VCSTRRHKPGVCTNTLALSIEEADEVILSEIEGEVLGTRYINQLLDLVDTAPDRSAGMQAEKARLQTEIDHLVESVAAGMPQDAIISKVRANTDAIAELDRKLRIPRPPRVDVEDLRSALEQRAKDWKRKLRQKPEIARMVLRQCVGPITLWDDTERPEFLKWTTTPKTDMLNGLAQVPQAPTLVGAAPRC
jgi:hypothetical protein